MHKAIDRLARLFAILGGVVLCALIVMTCLSIAGRSLNSLLHSDFLQSAVPGMANALLAMGVAPINGDFELVEAGMAFTIFAFLPLCHLRGSHASVDILTAHLSTRTAKILRTVIEFVFLAVLLLITFELINGMESKRRSGQTTFLLQYPIWWAYAASLSGAVVWVLTSVYTAFAHLFEVITGRHILPADVEAAQ